MPVSAVNIIDIFGQFGLIGLVLYIWWQDRREIQTIRAEDKKDLQYILDVYQADMAATKKMYDNNVELVKDYQSLATDLHDLVIMNTQAMQKVFDAVTSNQFCPMNRIDTHQTKRGG